VSTITRTISGDTPSSVTLLTLIRQDTGANVPVTPPLPQPFALFAGGQWSFGPFTDPGPSLTYTYAYQVNWPDGSYDQASDTLLGPGRVAAGYYAIQADIENVFGSYNVSRWSDMDNTSNPPNTNCARVQAALDYSTAEINNYFRDGPYELPLSLSSDPQTLTNWSAVIAGAWLYFSRGQRDREGAGNQYLPMLQRIYADMALYKGGTKRLNAPRRWPTPSAPSAANTAPSVTGY
jgi:phage gp36-like protein